MRYCDNCGLFETEIEETIYSCDCVKQRGKYDLDRALSEIERFFNEGKSSGVRRSWLDYPNGKNNPVRGRRTGSRSNTGELNEKAKP